MVQPSPRRWSLWLVPLLWTLAAPTGARAGGGGERTLLVVNEASPLSVQVAHRYQALRDIPDSHVLYLSFWAGYQYAGQATITLAETLEQILVPILEYLDRSDLVNEVDQIVYSTGFPYVVDIQEYGRRHGLLSTTASLTGLTYFAHAMVRDDPFVVGPTANAYFRGGTVIGGQDLGEMAPEERDLALQAYQEYKARRYAAAATLYRKLLETWRGTDEHWYNLACCLSLTGQTNQAMDALERAVANGWSDHYWTRTDQDLRALRLHERFHDLLRVMEERKPLMLPSHGFRTAALWRDRAEPHFVSVWEATEKHIGGYYLTTLLGHTGVRGNTLGEVLGVLERGAASDGTHPAGKVLMVRGRDKRLRARMSQIEAAQQELEALGVAVEIVLQEDPDDPGWPAVEGPLIGALLGAEDLGPRKAPALAPGALVDNLTPWGGAFWSDQEVKASALLRQGAVATSGPVTESDITVAKYPTARLLYHYLQGCSAAEAYYQSVSSPFQLLVLGDALARPYATFAEVALADPQQVQGPVSGTVNLPARVTGGGDGVGALELWVDGWRLAEAAPDEALVLDTSLLDDGAHQARLVAVQKGPLETRSVHRFPLLVDNHGLRVTVAGPQGPVPWGETVDLHGTAAGGERAWLVQGSRTLAEAPVAADGAFTLTVPSERLAPGTSALRVTTVQTDGQRAVGGPVSVTVQPPPTRAAAHQADPSEAPPGLLGTVEAPDGRSARFALTGLDPLSTWPLYEAVQEVGGGEGTRITLEGEVRLPASGTWEWHFYSSLEAEVTLDGTPLLRIPAETPRSRCALVGLAEGWHPLRLELVTHGDDWMFQVFLSGAGPGFFPGADALRWTEQGHSRAEAPTVEMEGAHANAELQDGDRFGAAQSVASGTFTLSWKSYQSDLGEVVLYFPATAAEQGPAPTAWVLETRRGRAWSKVQRVETLLGWDGARGSRANASPAWVRLSFPSARLRELRLRPEDGSVTTVALSEIEVYRH